MILPASTLDLLRKLSIFLVALAHMQDVFPLAVPGTVLLFTLLHLGQFQLFRRWPAVIYFVLALIGYTFFLLVIHNTLRDYSLFHVIRQNARVIYLLVIFLLFAHLKPHVEIERTLFRSMLFAGAAISLLTLYSRLVSPLEIAGARLTSHTNMLNGLVGSHNSMGGMLGSLTLLPPIAWLHSRYYETPKLLSRGIVLASGIVAVAFVFALSRSYTLGVFAAVGLTVLRIREPKLRNQGILIAAAGVLLVGSIIMINRSRDVDYANVDTRFTLYTRGLQEFGRSPIIGVGIGSFEEWHVTYKTVVPHVLALRQQGRVASKTNNHDAFGQGGVHVHNTYLQMLCDFGLLGAILLATIFWLPLSRFRKLPELDCDAWDLAYWNWSVVITTLLFSSIAGMFSVYCFSAPQITLFLYASLGRLVAHNDVIVGLVPLIEEK